jgi:lactoylglutathione lyase
MDATNNAGMTLTLWKISEPVIELARKRNIRLHHLAISVPSFRALDDLHEKIRKTPNIVIEFAPELAYGGPAKHMMFSLVVIVSNECIN